MFSSLSEASWLADHAEPGPAHLGTDNDTRPFLDGEDFRAEAKGRQKSNRETFNDLCYEKNISTEVYIS